MKYPINLQLKKTNSMLRKIKNYVDLFKRKVAFMLLSDQAWRPLSKFEIFDEPKPVIDEVKRNTMLFNDLRLINIKETVKYVTEAKINGAYVECGVWKGGSSAYAAYCFKRLNNIVPIHMFDVFQDICEPDAEVDGERAIREVGGIQNARGRLKSVDGFYDILGGYGNEINVNNLLTGNIINYPIMDIYVHKGWFQDVLPTVSTLIGPISVLRLDGDWYSSTKVCLEYLYKYVEKGGVVIVDDYGCYEGCRKAVDEFLAHLDENPYLIKVDDECIYFVKG